MSNAEHSAHVEFAGYVREEVTAALEGATTRVMRRVKIERIEPDLAAEWPTVIVLLTDTARPGCLFGKRCSTDVVDVTPDTPSSFRLAASICIVNIEEAFEADDADLPEACSGGTITWI